MPKTYYTANNNKVYPIRLSAADIAAQPTTGGAPSTTEPTFAKVSKSIREYGVRPRGVILGITLGTTPNTFVRYKRLAVLLPADLVTILASATFSYGGKTYDVLGSFPELMK